MSRFFIGIVASFENVNVYALLIVSSCSGLVNMIVVSISNTDDVILLI